MWGNRAVTFDGTTQNTAQAHWIGKVLLTDNEQEAVGILRMLDCGERQGFDMLNKEINDEEKTISLLYKIFPLDKNGARIILEEQIPKEKIESILDKTHCEPPENYFITSEDMVGKSGVWAHFGSWNFERALIYNTLNQKEYSEDSIKSAEFLKERFGYTQERAESVFFEVQDITDSGQANTWIAPWPGYAGVVGCGSPNEDNVLNCGNGFIVNLTTNDAYANTPQGTLHPKKISFHDANRVTVKEYNESIFVIQNGRELGLALVKNGESYTMVQMDSDLTGSMFTRMFYQGGVGLKYFKFFTQEQTVFGAKIVVWKVDWDGIPDEPEEKPIEENIVQEEENTKEVKEEVQETNNTQTNETPEEQTEEESVEEVENNTQEKTLEEEANTPEKASESNESIPDSE